MTPLELMQIAIAEAEKCNWPADEEASKPKVGAVISINASLVASAHRGTDDHAEKIALSGVSLEHDLSESTVWTTLEPCTPSVRRKEGDSCTERIIRAGVRKVVIGILDPNQGVCGKGLLQLQEHRIEVELFPHELVKRIRRLNDRFIQSQQSLGIKITSPRDGDVLTPGDCTIKGTFINPPGPEVIALTYVKPIESLGLDGGWWPQGPLVIVPSKDREWEARVQFGSTGPLTIYIVKANDLGIELVRFYEALKEIRNRVILRVGSIYCRDLEHVRMSIAPSFWQIPMSSLPKGLDFQDSVTIEVAEAGGT